MSVLWYVLEVPVAVERSEEESFPKCTIGGSSKANTVIRKM